MISGYVICVVSAVLIGALTWLLSLFSVPLWAVIAIGGAVVPVYASLGFLWLFGMFSIWRKFLKKEEATDEQG
jgi:hypothetical protein